MDFCSKFLLREPYPTIRTKTPSPMFVRQILTSYAGPQGELSTILQYFYNHLAAQNVGYPNLSELFECISQVEMRHLDLLGHLILAYGGNPMLIYHTAHRSRPQWWNTSFINYRASLAEILRNASNGEHAAVEEYSRLKHCTQDADTQALLDRIIADEEHHIQLFSQALHAFQEK